MKILGIDIGYDGGMVVINSEDRTIVWFSNIPTYTIMQGKKKRRKYDISEICTLIQTKVTIDHAVLEQLHAFPKQGGVSNFSTGYGAGMYEGILTSLEILYEKVTPQAWKKHFSLLKQTKHASVQKANELLGMNLKKTQDGIAEAALLALYIIRRRL